MDTFIGIIISLIRGVPLYYLLPSLLTGVTDQRSLVVSTATSVPAHLLPHLTDVQTAGHSARGGGTSFTLLHPR